MTIPPRGQHGIATTVMLAIVLITAGCGDNDSATTQSGIAVDQATRQVQATRQQINMTPAELDRAAELDGTVNAKSAQVKRQAAQVVDRMEPHDAAKAFNQAMEQTQSFHERIDDGDQAALEQLADHLLNACAMLDNIESTIAEERDAIHQKRLEQAVDKLKKAVAYARSEGQNEAAQGSQLTLAAVQLTLARRHYLAMERGVGDLVSQQTTLTTRQMPLAIEEVYEAGLTTFLPDAIIAVVRTQIKGDPTVESIAAALEAQLTECQAQIDTLSERYEQTQDKLKQQKDRLSALRHEYLELMAQADEAMTPKRYELQKQAYAIRSGRADVDAPAAPEQGEIYLEAKIEATQNELFVMQSELNVLNVKKQQLADTIGRSAELLAELEASPAGKIVAETRNEMAERKEQIVQLISNELNQLAQTEAAYRAHRVDAVTYYKGALESYQAAQRAARGNRDVAEFVENITGLIKTEMAGMWSEDAGTYRGLSVLLGMLSHIEALADHVEMLKSDYDTQAQQAAAAAEQLAPAAVDDQING